MPFLGQFMLVPVAHAYLVRGVIYAARRDDQMVAVVPDVSVLAGLIYPLMVPRANVRPVQEPFPALGVAEPHLARGCIDGHIFSVVRGMEGLPVDLQRDRSGVLGLGAGFESGEEPRQQEPRRDHAGRHKQAGRQEAKSQDKKQKPTGDETDHDSHGDAPQLDQEAHVQPPAVCSSTTWPGGSSTWILVIWIHRVCVMPRTFSPPWT